MEARGEGAVSGTRWVPTGETGVKMYSVLPAQGSVQSKGNQCWEGWTRSDKAGSEQSMTQ